MEQPPRPSKLYVPGPISEDDLPEELDDTLKDVQNPKPRRVRVKSVERPEPATPKLTNKAKKEARLKAAQENPLEAPEPKHAKSKPGKPPGGKKIPKTKKSKSKDAAVIKAMCDTIVHVQLADPVMFWRDQHSLFAHTDINNMISASLEFADWLALRRTCRAAYLRTSYTKLLKRRTTYLEDRSLDPAVMAKLLKLTLYTNYLVYVLEKKPAAPGKADLSFLKRPIGDELRRAIFDKTHSINAYKAVITGLAKEIATFADVKMVSKMSPEFYNNPKGITGCFGLDANQNDDIFETEYNSDDEPITHPPTIPTPAKIDKVNTEVLIWIINRNVQNFNGSAQSNLMFILDMARSHGKWSFMEQIKFEEIPQVIVDSWFNNILSYLSARDCGYAVEKLKRLDLPKCLGVRKYVRISNLVMPMLGYKPFEDEFWVREEHSP
jgi:hypothetical protein